MAITLQQEPYQYTPVGQKLIVTATSDNISEPGFRYYVEWNINNTIIAKYYKPNRLGAFVAEIQPLINLENEITYGSETVHGYTATDWADEPGGKGQTVVSMELFEAWVVDGVLTNNPDELDPVGIHSESSGCIFWNGTYQASDGFNPNPATRYLLDGTTKRWLSDRDWNTHRNDAFMSQTTTRVLIPVREADWGVLSMFWFIEDATAAVQVNVTIFDANGAPHEFDIDYTADGTTMMHFPLYPANLNASSFAEKPEDYPGWRYIQIRAENADGSSVKSVNYLLYNVAYAPYQAATDCIHDVVRIGWKNYAGGWDYFNFTKRNEPRINIDRKRFQKVLGNFGDVDGSTDFNFTKQDSGLMELKQLVNKYLDVHSDWISEQEFVFLESLFVSQQVHWIHDDGTFTPVLVEQDDYLMARERNGRLKNIQTKFRLANPVWV